MVVGELTCVDLIGRLTGLEQLAVLPELSKVVDYGIVQLYLDGNKRGEPVDLFNKGVVPTSELELGVHNLDAGGHVFRVEIAGANEAVKAYMFGLDYLLLEEAK